jgi:hypothetical protein
LSRALLHRRRTYLTVERTNVRGRLSKLLLPYQLLLGAALSLVVLDLGAGCGAMFNGSTTVVPVNASPRGARVYVDGLYVAQAPGNLVLSNANPHTIDIDADGYQKQSMHVDARTNGGYVALDCLLLVFGILPGIIALVVDGSTGDWRNLDTTGISAALTPAFPAPAGAGWYPAPANANPWNPPPTAPANRAAQPAPTTGCQYDAQCKNERICKGGQCVDPAPSP